MFPAIIKAFGQLSDPATRRILWKCLIATALLFAVLLVGVEWALAKSHLFNWAVLDWVADILGGVGAVIVALLLFPAAMLLVLGFFLEDVAALVEARHYPGLPPPRAQGLAEVLRDSLRFAVVAIGLNLLALPFVVALTFLPPFNLLVFYALNGYLLGREYFELVALRRLPSREARALRQAFAGRIFLAGAAITFLSTVPLANLLTPVVATAFMVHMVESMRGAVLATRDSATK
ncbi:MAG TPA: EI24 domain-containing protein [Alphaproteobacteria bacterium]|nr:EI24 domain-containing protein [Alphaproteobacteria bacterium]